MLGCSLLFGQAMKTLFTGVDPAVGVFLAGRSFYNTMDSDGLDLSEKLTKNLLTNYLCYSDGDLAEGLGAVIKTAISYRNSRATLQRMIFANLCTGALLSCRLINPYVSSQTTALVCGVGLAGTAAFGLYQRMSMQPILDETRKKVQACISILQNQIQSEASPISA